MQRGFILPANCGYHPLGATFNFKDLNLLESNKEHELNLKNLSLISRKLYNSLNSNSHIENDKNKFNAYVGLRSTTPDYLPLIGEVANAQEFNQQFNALRKNAKHIYSAGCEPQVYKGLYVNIAHGSRGSITAPIGADIISNMISNDILPISNHLREAIHPARFLARSLIKNK